MYRIGDILEQALLLHDCVVLPTIGAFIVEQTPPLYDKDLNVITPAGQRISFNASLVDRDGILDSCYARTLGLSVRRHPHATGEWRATLYPCTGATRSEIDTLLRTLPSELLASSRLPCRAHHYRTCQ